MRPMRAGGGGYGQFLNMRNVAFKLAIGIVAGSLLDGLFRKNFGASLLALTPWDFIHHFRLWQPITYSVVAHDPLGVIFGAIIAWQMGGSLEMTWGSKRLLLFSVGVTTLAGLLTVGLSLLPGLDVLNGVAFPGAYVMTSALWVAYGLAWRGGMVNFWGLPLTGNQFAGVGVLFVVLSAVFGSVLAQIPSVLALIMTFLYVRYGSAGTWLTRFRAWQVQRKLKNRSKHLSVVGRNEVRKDYLN